MNILRKSIIVGMTMLTIGSAAMAAPAQETPQHRAYAETKFDPAKRAERIERRQQALHDALKLTGQQEAAWKTYISSIKPPQAIGREHRVSFKELTAPQRAEKRLELSRTRLAHQEARLEALKTFYAALAPEQQRVFDERSAPGKKKGLHRRQG